MKFKRLLTILFLAVFAFGFVGCSSNSGNETDTQALMSAVEKFEACNSYSMVQLTERSETIKAENTEQTYTGFTQMSVDLIKSPNFSIHSETLAKVEFGTDQIEQNIISYIVPENGGYTEYYGDGTEWYKYSTNDVAAAEAMGDGSVIDTLYIDEIMFSKVGSDKLVSGNATRYEGALKGEQLVAMLEANGHLTSIYEMSEAQQTLIRENLAKDLDYVTVCVWVDDASGYPVRFEVNLSDIIKDFEKSYSKSLGNRNANNDWVITDYVISITLSNFNSVSEIVPPAEVASAQVYVPEENVQS